jgi:hypothetical protein
MNATIERNRLDYADTKEAINSVVRGLIDEAQREYIVDRRRERCHSLAILLNVAPIKDGQLGTELAIERTPNSTRRNDAPALPHWPFPEGWIAVSVV